MSILEKRYSEDLSWHDAQTLAITTLRQCGHYKVEQFEVIQLTLNDSGAITIDRMSKEQIVTLLDASKMEDD